VAREPVLRELLDSVIKGPLFTADELPEPRPHQREAPTVQRLPGNAQQVVLGLDA